MSVIKAKKKKKGKHFCQLKYLLVLQMYGYLPYCTTALFTLAFLMESIWIVPHRIPDDNI